MTEERSSRRPPVPRGLSTVADVATLIDEVIAEWQAKKDKQEGSEGRSRCGYAIDALQDLKRRIGP